MARIAYPDPTSLAPETQEMLAKIGDPPMNIFRMLAGGEGLLRAFTRFGNHLLFKTKLDPVLREAATALEAEPPHASSERTTSG